LRVAAEMEKASWSGKRFSRYRVIDVFPAPEGAVMMTIFFTGVDDGFY
jgi:hypothetical protein